MITILHIHMIVPVEGKSKKKKEGRSAACFPLSLFQTVQEGSGTERKGGKGKARLLLLPFLVSLLTLLTAPKVERMRE